MVDWRWSSQPITAAGLHGSVYLIFPAVIITRLSSITFGLSAMYVAYLVLCKFNGYGPIDYARYLHMKYLQGGVWRVR